MKKLRFVLVVTCLLWAGGLIAQTENEGQLNGNFYSEVQYYQEDSIIGASKISELMGLNSYANFGYTRGNFKAGMRYEGYMPPLQGYDPRYKGVGIPYRYLTYAKENEIEVTVGNFYEQFGVGLVLGTYEDKNLGYDNALEGARVRYQPLKGLYLKGLIGRQRNFWDQTGLIRGADAELNINEAFEKFAEKKVQLIIGASVVSKYQEDKDPLYKFPENVGAGSFRTNLSFGKFNFYGEYAYKHMDPSTDNNKIYKPGNALLLNASFSTKGLGILLTAKRVDNMSFRSDRSKTVSELNINYVPDLTKPHSYSLAAMYPYATQLTGEMGFSVDVMYKLKKETALGGKYGTLISFNYSLINNINKTAPSDTSAIGIDGTYGYSSDPFKIGDEQFYSDVNIDINRKFSNKFHGNIMYQHVSYNQDVIHGANSTNTHGIIDADIVVADMTFRFKNEKGNSNAFRLELESLTTDKDFGDWAMGVFEYSIPHWFITVMDQYNYGNPDAKLQVHYYSTAVGYVKGSTRIEIGYGKRKAGVLCVGGVCRPVPASNGFLLSIFTSF